MENPPRNIKLWVLDVFDNSFSIVIKDTQTVEDLKNEIVTKNPNTFANVDALQLRLWKVSHIVHFRRATSTTFPQGVYPGYPTPVSEERSSETTDSQS